MVQAVIVKHLGISLATLRKVVFLVQEQTVRYDPETGAQCPVCKTDRARIYCSSMPIRHHRCQTCGARFKSIEPRKNVV